MPRLRAPLAAGVAILAVAAAPAPAAGSGQGGPEPRSVEREATRLFEDAVERVRRRHRECRPTVRRPRSVEVTPGPIGPPYTDVLSIFRRPPSLSELALGADTKRMMAPGTEAVFGEGVRTAVAADGTQVTVRLFDRVGRLGVAPAVRRRCDARIRDLLKGSSRAARRARELLGEARPDDAPEPWLMLGQDAGVGGGPFDVRRFTEQGQLMSTGTGPGGRTSRSRVFGLVPDGVATVILDYPRRASRGPRRRARDYGTAVRRITPVQDNVVAVEVPRDATDALGSATLTWLAPGGAKVRVVRPER